MSNLFFKTVTTPKGTLAYQNDFHRINYKKSGTLTEIKNWTAETSLPGTFGYGPALVIKNRVYLFGRFNGSAYDVTLYNAPIDANGNIGTWTSGTNVPSTFRGLGKVMLTKSRVYLFGGYNGSAYTSSVSSAPVASDGTIGAWVTEANLPGKLGLGQLVQTKNRVYLLGGYNNSSYVSVVYTAPLNKDGTIGTWTTGTSLPIALGYAGVLVTKNRVYLIGGYNGSTISTVYTAPINADGTLGTWTTGPSLPGASSGLSHIVATKNRVFCLGGYTDSAYSNIQYSAPINADGTLGAWETKTALNSIFYEGEIVVTKSKVYRLGGYNGSAWGSAVYSAPFSDGWDNSKTTYLR